MNMNLDGKGIKEGNNKMKNKIITLKEEEYTISLNYPYVRKVIEKLELLEGRLEHEGRVDDELDDIIHDLHTAIGEWI